MGINALRQNLGGTEKKPRNLTANISKNFNGLKDYIEKTKKFARENGWTETLSAGADISEIARPVWVSSKRSGTNGD